MKNIKFFKDQAQNSTQKDFNEKWVDNIIDISNKKTVVLTDERTILNVIWDIKGKNVDYFIVIEKHLPRLK
jgi:hypothetical protein